MYKERAEQLRGYNDFYLRMINDYGMNGIWIKVLRNTKLILSLEEEMIPYNKEELFNEEREEQ